MIFGYFTLFVALVISTVAAYYSIVGLTAIFASAVVSVIIMGVALEIGKITAAVWLKLNWSRANLTYKLYLVPAVAILMFLTSMGIFGFLSKAHLDQTSGSQENAAQIERLNSEIGRKNDIIKRAEAKIRELESSGTGQDAQIQSQIDREQARIDAALKRIEPAIKEQNDIIIGQNKIYQDQLSRIDQDLSRLQTNLDKNDIAAAQSQVGVQPDGRIGPRTQQAFKEYRERLTKQKQDIIDQIEKSNNTPAVQAARKEIQRIRSTVETQINESNQLINRLRQQVGKSNNTNIDSLIDEQNTRIRSTNTELEQLIEQKYKLESEFRKLEAEVGPIKYLAQLIYDENPDQSILEKAVRFVIIIIVAVFDPLALVLILAAQQSIRWNREDANKVVEQLDNNNSNQIDSSPQDKQNDDSANKIDEKIDPETPPEDNFDISKHAYLFKPWVSITGKKPIPGNLPSVVDEPSITEETSKPVIEETVQAIDPPDKPKQPHVREAVDLERGHPEVPVEAAERHNKKKMINQLTADNDTKLPKEVKAHFGIDFPVNPEKGEIFLRVDFLPSKLFKFNGNMWIEVDKAITNSYVYNEDFIKYLITEIEAGHIDPEDLTSVERDQISEFLSKNEPNRNPS